MFYQVLLVGSPASSRARALQVAPLKTDDGGSMRGMGALWLHVNIHPADMQQLHKWSKYQFFADIKTSPPKILAEAAATGAGVGVFAEQAAAVCTEGIH